MKPHNLTVITFILAASLAWANETVTWHRQAFGQQFLCPIRGTTWYWPNNNNWSQSQLIGDPCSEGASVVQQPSNWSTPNYPNGATSDVILGSLGGAPANLDLGVTLHSLTIQSDGALNMQFGSSITANVVEFQGDTGITVGGGGGGWPAIYLPGGGLLLKSGGTGSNAMTVPFYNSGGTIQVNSGMLSLGGGGGGSNANFTISSGATLDLTGGSSPTCSGWMTGSGAGQVRLASGAISTSPSLTLNLPGALFQWTGGQLAGVTTNLNSLTVAGLGAAYVGGGFFNSGVVHQTNAATLAINSSSHFDNLPGGTYKFESDVGIGPGNCCGGDPVFNNFGLVRKSNGSGASLLNVLFNNYNGALQVDSGTLSLAGSGSSSNGTFTVASGAVLDLTGGSSPIWAGQMNGNGAGTVILTGGTISTSPSLTLNFPAGMFQWSGGQLAGTTTNSNAVTIAGLGSVYVGGGFYNYGMVHHTNTATLAVDSSAHFENLTGASYNLENNGGIGSGYCCGGTPYFDNSGLLRKSGGTGNSIINIPVNNQNGLIEVDSGSLSLTGGGSSSNGTINVASGAVLDLTGGSSPNWAGQMNGSGAGAVILSSGTIGTSPSLTLNLPAGLFQWTGGQFSGTTINSNIVTVAGSNTVFVGVGFYNYGVLRHAGTNTLAVNWSSHFENQLGGTYDFQNNGGIGFGYCCGGTPALNNYGLLRKSGGGGTSAISIPMNNFNGTVQVDSGTLSLAGGGSSSNATLNVAGAAVLDLTGGGNPTWAGQMNGTGAGTVALSGGTISATPSLTLNLSQGLLQWTGGQFAGTTINSNTLTIAGTGTVYVAGGFYNYGVVHHTATATLAVNMSSHFENQAGGIYSLEGDVNLVTGYCCGGTPSFNNYGLLRKSSGTGTAALNIEFANQGGAVEVDSGTLSVGNYVQGGGAFTVQLGGRGAGQTGRLGVNSASLNGPLNVRLANGFAPMVGEQFQILSSSGLSGAFNSLNIPTGIAVTYTNNSVFLVVTGTVPSQMVNSVVSGNSLAFCFGTVSNQSYTVQRNDDLNTTNWDFYTNFTGNGSLMQVLAPVTNVPQRFFRVRQP